jgi:membrane associated rhomboid family serine protease
MEESQPPTLNPLEIDTNQTRTLNIQHYPQQENKEAKVPTTFKDTVKNLINTLFPFVLLKSVCTLLMLTYCLTFLLQIIHFLYFNEKDWNCVLYLEGGKYTPAITHDFHIHRLVISNFLHGNFVQLFYNCISLLFMGYKVEYVLGHFKFFTLYILSGIFSFSISALVDPKNVSVGASSSIFGLSGFYILCFLVNYKYLSKSDKIMYIIYVIMTISNLIDPTIGGNKVDFIGHLSGIIAGLFLSIYFLNSPHDSPWVNFFKYRNIFLVGYILAQSLSLFFIMMMDVPANTFHEKCAFSRTNSEEVVVKL